MNERLLQYIWQQQLFNKDSLVTLKGEPLQIIHPGVLNRNQGPDFLQASIRIGNTRWVGNIELHVLSSHWVSHGHEKDEFYNNVILHVVWQADKDIVLRFPTLMLSNRVSMSLLNRYDQLSASTGFIPCANQISGVPAIIKENFFERCFAERLEAKARQIAALLPQTNGSWDEVSWLMLAKRFGQPVNELAFSELAGSLSWKTIARHRFNPIQIEALLFGQTRLLQIKSSQDYIMLLQKEYRFLRKKIKLFPIHFPLKFMRMRPANFPSVRLAQLAALIAREPSLFNRIIQLKNRSEVYAFFNLEISPYWQYHYRPGDKEKFRPKHPGKSFCHHLIINLIAPLKFCHGLMLNDDTEKAGAINLLCQLPPEDNCISRNFIRIGVKPVSAADTQALIHLKHHYCNQLKCLQCAIGHSIIKSS